VLNIKNNSLVSIINSMFGVNHVKLNGSVSNNSAGNVLVGSVVIMIAVVAATLLL